MELIHTLTRPVTALKGIGEHQGKRLNAYMAKQKKQIGSAEIRNLLFHLPYDYIDRRHITTLADAKEGIQTVQLRTLKHLPAPRQPRGRPAPYRVQCEDDTGSILLVFFRGDTRYLTAQLPLDQEVIVSGELQRYDGMWQMTHPDIIVPPERMKEACRLDAIYPATEGISSKMFSRWIDSALNICPQPEEWQLASTLQHHSWPDFKTALHTIHRPDDLNDITTAKARLAYDEALAHQLALQLLRQQQKRVAGIPIHCMDNPAIQDTITKLPFTLTDGQTQVMHDISTDMTSGERMIRLLQGDVGAGKTVVAILAMLATVKAGYQAGIMAPTEILARQHLHSLDKLLGMSDIPVIFLAGSLTPKQREEAREHIRTTPAALIVGTHALFQEGVEFASLALAVIDEQHRFGVEQRMALSDKGLHPHLLLMTATPIPRSLSMAQYGDLDVSVLAQKPASRQPIDTRVLPLGKLDALVEGMQRAIKDGEKVYWVCPLVEESTNDNPDMQWQAAKARYAYLQVLFPNQVGMVHGKMKMAEREPVMQGFANGELRILVATTVVEVGVDVPDATIMVIENAERFGLAQLHQLRGRVGRGSKQSRCILLYAEKCSVTARKRLKTMRDTEDGFVISEADLRLRGSGEILGTRQTGLPDYTFLDLQQDAKLLASARKDAALALEQDAQLNSPRGTALRGLLALFNLKDATRFLRSG